MVPLPPDLQRLGDELTAAAARALDERRRRRRLTVRLAVSALAGILTLTAFAPVALSPERRMAALLDHESMATVLVRLPDRPAPLPRPPDRTRALVAPRPERPPHLPAIALERDG